MHLSIEIPTPPSPSTPGQGGGMWGIFMAFEGTVCPWGWGISQHLHLHIHRGRGARWGFDSCQFPHGNFFTWSLVSLAARWISCSCLVRHLVLKGKFPNYFPFIPSFRLILWDFALSFHGSLTGKCYCL